MTGSPAKTVYVNRKQIKIINDKSTTSAIGRSIYVDIYWYEGPKAK